ncbi:MAG: type IV pilin [Candidatus Pacearchaeota archaeon]|nr:type IV pilin [Candidatus Pacearchaeota archaeon]
MYKRGVSPVIATVLLIVITVVVAAIIMSFALPFAKDKLAEGNSCLDNFIGVEFALSKFNCFTSSGIGTSGSDGNTGFSVKLNGEDVEGFRISLIKDEDGSSKTYTIMKSDTTLPGIRMVGGLSTIEFPETGGQRSYVVSGKYSSAEIAPILKDGQVCSISDNVEFKSCSTDVSL